MAGQVVVDPTQSLVYIADESRVKSFRYSTGSSPVPKDGLPVHTLKSAQAGPIAVVDDGNKI